MLLMSCFSIPILLLHTYILLMYCLLFGLCIEMPSYVVYKGKVLGVPLPSVLVVGVGGGAPAMRAERGGGGT